MRLLFHLRKGKEAPRRGLPEVEKMLQTIKILILEFMAGNGPGHIREIHLKIAYPAGLLFFRKLDRGD